MRMACLLSGVLVLLSGLSVAAAAVPGIGTERLRVARPVPARVGEPATLAAQIVGSESEIEAPPIAFNRDVRPILSENCWQCHGPDEAARKAGLRLDSLEGAVAERKGGVHAVVPGDVDASALVYRIETDDIFDQMPPLGSNLELDAEQIDVLRRWVAEGARWESHWAFVPPRAAPAPPVSRPEWVLDPLDAFVLARLDEAGIAPSPEADRQTLIRRVSFDLTGLPPRLDEIDAFLADELPGAYERAVGSPPPRPCSWA